MKAPFSPLARRLFADSVAREQLREFIASSGLAADSPSAVITDSQGKKYTARIESIYSMTEPEKIK